MVRMVHTLGWAPRALVSLAPQVALAMIVAGPGCAQDNPAFDRPGADAESTDPSGDGDASTTTPETGDGDSNTTTPETGDGDGDSSTTTPGDGDGDSGDGDGDPGTCGFEAREPLGFRLPVDGNDCPPGGLPPLRVNYEWNDQAPGVIGVTVCEDKECNSCPGPSISIGVEAFPLLNEAWVQLAEGAALSSLCLEIETHNLIGQIDAGCIYGSYSIHETSEVLGTLAAGGREGTTPTPRTALLLDAGVPKALDKSATCECEDVWDNLDEIACCMEAANIPTELRVVFNEVMHVPGDVALHFYKDRNWVFHLAQAQDVPGCSKWGPESSWVLLRTP